MDWTQLALNPIPATPNSSISVPLTTDFCPDYCFKRQEMNYGIEPDECFYIQNHQPMIGKERIDLAVDPPPDLAIEIDITSKTQMDAYTRLSVPELWIYRDDSLQLYTLQAG